MEIAHQYHINVIEDACHAHGAKYKNINCGNIGDMSVFSFQATKLLPAGEGGMFLTNNEENYEKALAIGHYERLNESYLRKNSSYLKYSRTSTHGMKFRMSPLHAAIGLAYLERLDEDHKIRNKNCEQIRSIINSLPGFTAYSPPKEIYRVYYENLVNYEEKSGQHSFDKVINALKAEGADITPSRYPLLHQQAFFSEKGYEYHLLPITEQTTAKLIKLPNFSTKNDLLVRQYIDAFEKVMKNRS
jgi:dTDP-4-amino-4,6-dideoxygalactose transaminase